MTLRAVLLDYGHTIVDYERPETELLAAYHRINQRLEAELEDEIPAAAELLQALSVGIDATVADSYRSGSEQEVDFGSLYDEALAGLGLSLDPGLRRWAMQEEQAAWMAGLRCSPHAADTFRELRARGLRLVIVSNAAYPAASMRAHLDNMDLLGFFDATVYSSEVGWRKPNRTIYDEALRCAGATAAEVLFVGDRLREDVRGPRAAGIRAVLTHEFRQETPAPHDGDVEVIASLRELVPLVAG